MARWSVYVFVLLQAAFVLAQDTETPETSPIAKETLPPTKVEPTRVPLKGTVTPPPLVHAVTDAVTNATQTTAAATTSKTPEQKSAAASLRVYFAVSVLGVVLTLSAI